VKSQQTLPRRIGEQIFVSTLVQNSSVIGAAQAVVGYDAVWCQAQFLGIIEDIHTSLLKLR
jgi:hypothetical protein